MSGWIKAYRTMADHPVLQRADALGVWTRLLLQAARVPIRVKLRGKPVSLEAGQLALSVVAEAEKLGVTYKRLRLIMASMRDEGMIKWVKAQGQVFTVVTICNYSRYQHIDGEEGRGSGRGKGEVGARLGPTEQEVIITPPSPSESGPPVVEPKPKRERRTKSAIPDGWKPDATAVAYAKAKGFNTDQIETQAEKFVNYWLGCGGLKVDWAATWRHWVADGPKHNGTTERAKPRLVIDRTVDRLLMPGEAPIDWTQPRRVYQRPGT